jgi:phage baseplate assembly protein V
MGLSRSMVEQLRHLLRPLSLRIANSIARAVVQLVDDEKKLQLVQLGVLVGEDIDDCERFGEYGFFSVPLAGAEAVVLFPNGDRGHPLIVAIDDRRHRPRGGQGGESGLYTDEGDEIRLARGRIIVLTAGTEIRLGSDAASIPPALSTELAALKAAIAGWVPSAGDGGASLQAVFSAWLVPGATKVKVE